MDFGIDPDFNHCIDGLVWVDVSRIKPHKRARYIGSQQIGDQPDSPHQDEQDRTPAATAARS